MTNSTLNGQLYWSGRWHVCTREWTRKWHVLGPLYTASQLPHLKISLKEEYLNFVVFEVDKKMEKTNHFIELRWHSVRAKSQVQGQCFMHFVKSQALPYRLNHIRLKRTHSFCSFPLHGRDKIIIAILVAISNKRPNGSCCFDWCRLKNKQSNSNMIDWFIIHIGFLAFFFK